MLLSNMLLAKAMQTHHFADGPGEYLQTCQDCALQVPIDGAPTSFTVATIKPCPGQDEGQKDADVPGN